MSLVTAVTIAMLAVAAAAPASAQHWSYSGEAGPASGGKLDPEFAMCAIGRSQSPVDLERFVADDLRPLRIAFKAGAVSLTHNGYTVRADYAPGRRLTVEGRTRPPTLRCSSRRCATSRLSSPCLGGCRFG